MTLPRTFVARRRCCRARMVILAGLTAATLLPHLALAQEARAHVQDRPAVDSAYPIRIGDRPETLPHGDSRLDAFGFASRVPGSPTIVTVVFGGGIGVTDELEIGGQFVPWQVDPRVAFTNPSVYATYSFALNTAVAISPTIQTVYPLKSEDAFIVDVGSSLSLDIGPWGSLSFAPMLSLNTRQGESGSSLSFPLTTFWQASDHITLQLSSGVGFSRFDPRFGLSRRRDALDFNEVTIPATASLSYTAAHGSPRRPLVDLTVQFQWPQLYTRAPETQGFHTDDWTVQIQSSWFFVR